MPDDDNLSGKSADGASDEAVEPRVDPDSEQRLDEEITDAPHPGTRFEAPDGGGTATDPMYDRTLQERPVLDGATQSHEAEATVPNPYRGEPDPALVSRQPALNTTSTDRWLVASAVAGVLLSAGLLLLARWSPVWCGVGVIVALVALLAMLFVRMSKLGRRTRLRLNALLMAVLWLVPLAIILTVMIGERDDIWPFA